MLKPVWDIVNGAEEVPWQITSIIKRHLILGKQPTRSFSVLAAISLTISASENTVSCPSVFSIAAK
jgi:hypothetical protein